MTHRDILLKFRELFSAHLHDIDVWFPNGKGSVRVRLITKQELVFTYHNEKHWSLETVDMFLERTSVKK